MRNIVSIDWEDWFHVCEVDRFLPRSQWDTYNSILDEATDLLLAELAGRKTLATFFIVGYSAQRNPDLVRRIAREGHEIAYHTWDHNLLNGSDPESFRKDLRRGRTLLRELTGRDALGFRAPQWSLSLENSWAFDMLIDEGFCYDSSRVPLPIVGHSSFPEHVHVLNHSRRDGKILEIPPLVLNLPGCNMPAGGGWGLRCWPERAIFKKIRKLNRAGAPATFFFHPVEFVTHRFFSNLPLAKKYVLSFGLRSTKRAWDFLFDNIEFGTMLDASRLWMDAQGEATRKAEAS